MYMVHQSASTDSTTSGAGQHQKPKWFLLERGHEFALSKTVASMQRQEHLARTTRGTALAIRCSGYAKAQCRLALHHHREVRAVPSKFQC